MRLIGYLCPALALGLLLAGCAGSPPTRYYVLSALPADARAAPLARPLSVSIGPLELPAYLDRPQVVTRDAAQQATVAEFERWAEPVKDGMLRVLTENLSLLLPSEQVRRYPWRRADAPDYQVRLQVSRFERETGGEAVLAVRWSVLDREGNERLPPRSREYRAQPAGPDYPATVAALNAALADLSRDIAAALRGLPANR